MSASTFCQEQATSHLIRWENWASFVPTSGLVSVIVPIFNRVSLITETLASIRQQDYPQVEVIVVDDGSTDGSGALVQAYIDEYRLQQTWTLVVQPNGGAAAARNSGICASSGEFIIFVDSDDTLVPQALSTAIPIVARSNDESLSYFSVRVMKKNTESAWTELETIGRATTTSPGCLLDYCWHTMGPVYRKQNIVRIGPWFEGLRSSDDWEYSTRAKIFGLVPRFHPMIIGNYVTHGFARINVNEFSAEYVSNIAVACLKISSDAMNAGVLTPALKMRIINRLLVHALEASAAGDRTSSRSLRGQAVQLAGSNIGFTLVVAAATCLPGTFLNGIAWRLCSHLRVRSLAKRALFLMLGH